MTASNLFGKVYAEKVKSAAEIRALIGDRPRDRRVVMCHGTFDIVHPGHIRHLLYARERGDLLVVGITADHHIQKANIRPYVPHDLRALNLAALQMVDFVTVDPNADPLENIRIIQPDYFVKGYEYAKGGVHPKTAAEMEAVESYGGEMVFTPGDVVYSSSRIIDSMPPNISNDKLMVVMENEGITFEDLDRSLDALSGLKVHVVGDVIVDTQTRTTLIGANGKTPTFSVRYEDEVHYVGGAGVVAKHLQTAGAEVTLSTVLGDDALAELVRNDLASAGVRLKAVTDPTRPTTQKNAVVVGDYRMLKIDKLDNRAISDRIRREICANLSTTDADLVILSDFRHGVFSAPTTDAIIASIPPGALKVADSQVSSRWGNILDFKDFDLITPNEREARFAMGDQDTVIRPLGSRLYEAARCRHLLLKLGERGVIVFRPANPPGDIGSSFVVLDSFTDRVVDAVGSGAALLAYSALALRATGNCVIAGILGSFAAAVECELDGNIPVSLEQLRAKCAQIKDRCFVG